MLDFISVTSGSIYSSHLTRPGLYMPPGFAAHLAGIIKSAVPVPVIAQGSIVDPQMAASLLSQQQADAVEMTRALDRRSGTSPQDCAKVYPADVRPCILSNQDNIVGLVQNPRLSCVNNPAAGYEGDAEFAPLTRAPVHYRVMVVGAGPAGPRGGAGRGHARARGDGVRAERLGWGVRCGWRRRRPGRERLALAVDWLEAQVRKLNVTIRTGVRGDAGSTCGMRRRRR